MKRHIRKNDNLFGAGLKGDWHEFVLAIFCRMCCYDWRLKKWERERESLGNRISTCGHFIQSEKNPNLPHLQTTSLSTTGVTLHQTGKWIGTAHTSESKCKMSVGVQGRKLSHMNIDKERLHLPWVAINSTYLTAADRFLLNSSETELKVACPQSCPLDVGSNTERSFKHDENLTTEWPQQCIGCFKHRFLLAASIQTEPGRRHLTRPHEAVRCTFMDFNEETLIWLQ